MLNYKNGGHVKRIIIGSVFLFSVIANLYSENIEKYRDVTLDKLFKELKERIEITQNPKRGKEVIDVLKDDTRYFLKIKDTDKKSRTRLLELGFDIVEIKDGYLNGFIDKTLLGNISEKEYTVVEIKTIYEWAKIYQKDFPASDSAYHNYKETYDVLKSIAEKNSDITSFFSIGKSYEQRDIWCLRINPTEKGTTPSKKPGALIVGNHHAREHLTNEMVLLFAVYLLENRNDPEIKKYIENLDIFIIPMLNPDGVEYDIATGSYRYWRKNTNKFGGTKVIGTDLNRNYDFRWCKEGASTYQNSDTYCGPSVFSEPETKALRDFILANKNIKTTITYHSYASLVLYPWGGLDEPVSDEKDRNAFIKHANEMAKILGYKAEQSSELYVATGDMADWAYDKAKVLAWTIELEGNGFYPGSSIIDKAFERNKKACLYLLSITDNPYR
jgi:carboxypeptidase T